MLLRMLTRAASGSTDGSRLSILIFHRVLERINPLFPEEPDSADFDRILGWLKTQFTVLPLADAAEQLYTGRLPRGAACITFDDGYLDNYTRAMPLLQRHGLHATFFVATGYLGDGIMFNDAVVESITRTQHSVIEFPEIGVGALGLANTQARRHALRTVLPRLKVIEPRERSRLAAQFAQRCGVELPRNLMMNPDQVRAMADAGFEIGGHTHDHPILASVDLDTARTQIQSNRDLLVDMIKRPVRLFAYPNGRPGDDYRPEHAELVRDLGFETAVSTAHGVSTRATSRYELRRFTPWDRQALRFKARMLSNLRGGGS